MTAAEHPAIALEGVAKTFVMHLQGGLEIPVVDGVAFSVLPGECVVLGGPSGAGKSSLLRMIYGNYRVDRGTIRVRDGEGMVDVATARARDVLALRRRTIGYVSQFLRAIPRVSALDVVAQAGLETGLDPDTARGRARAMLLTLNIAQRLHDLPPATFSGGEQQRVNIARGFLPDRPILLLDEPTASLDAANRAVVVEMIRAKKARGTALVGVFHDEDVRDAVADRIIDVTGFAARSALAQPA